MTIETPDTVASKKKRLRTGRLLSIFATILSIASSLWQAWLLPIVDSLEKQGRYHEGDSDGCFYGMLMVPTYFIVPGIALLAIVLGTLGFRFRARALAIIAWIAALLTLIPMWPAWGSFFGG